jgi:hypothetical protein
LHGKERAVAVSKSGPRQRKLERVLESHLGCDAERSASLAADLLYALRELGPYDAVRRQYLIVRILIVLLTKRLAVQPEAHLPPPGTTLVEALYAEAEAMRSLGAPNGEPWGTFRDGHHTGWNAFLERLRSRADHLKKMGEDRPRPAPGDSVDLQPAITQAALGLSDAAEELRYWPRRISGLLAQSGSAAHLADLPAMVWTRGRGHRRDVPPPLVAELLATLPGPEDFQTTLSRLVGAGEELQDLRTRLCERRGGGGTTLDDRYWLNTLAAELRRLADMAVGGGGGHPFLSGYAMAGYVFADRLRVRADEVAVGRRWIVWRREGSRTLVEVAQTEYESDAKAVVATMLTRDARGRYQVSEWS